MGIATNQSAVLCSPKVAAVVPTYNRKTLLETCLVALTRQTHPLSGIYVVDNASTDGTADIVLAEFQGHVNLIRMSTNTGSAGGYREGLRRAYEDGYDWIWTMDHDAEPAEDALEQLLSSAAAEDSNVGILSSVVLDEDFSLTPHHHKKLSFLSGYIPVTADDLKGRDALPLAAKIKYLILNPKEAERMALNARQWARQTFTSERYAAEFIQVIKKVLSLPSWQAYSFHDLGS